jgi:4'-phosphopantetheinyl transferase
MSPTSETLPVVTEHDSPGLLNHGLCPELSGDEIHVWRQRISVTAEELKTLRELLSPEERNREERYRFEASRRTFVVCRGMLRVFLCGYLGTQPERFEFAYSEYGRPELVPANEPCALDFNVSHTEDFALLAFSRNRRIGVDIEQVRNDFNTSEIAERFFSESERTRLRRLAPSERHQSFFRCWTRKESFIKALGEGLSHPLDSFDVSIEPDDPPRLLATRPNDETSRWQLWDINVPSGYVAALAAEIKPSWA